MPSVSVLKFDSSNIKVVYYTPDKEKQSHLNKLTGNIKDDGTAEDSLFQVLVRLGRRFNIADYSSVIANKTVCFVDDNDLVAYFNISINEAFDNQLAARQPLRVVFRDSGFASDNIKFKVEQIFKLISPTTEIKIIKVEVFMNHIQEISTQCKNLPEDLQKQVLDFIYFLEARYTQNQIDKSVCALTDAELEQSCRMLKTSQGVNLEQMSQKKRKSVILGVMAEEFAIPVDFDKPLPESLMNEFYTDTL